MSRAQAFQIFRSCASSASARPSANVMARQSQRAMVAGRRYYSDDSSKSEESKDEGKKEEAAKEQSEASPDKELAEKLKSKDAEVADLKARLQYLQADFLNLQRNAAREKEQTRDFAITRFASDLLETVDVLSLALKSVPPSALEASAESSSLSSSPADSTATETSSTSETPSLASSSSTPTPKSTLAYLRDLHEGVDLTHRQLLGTLFKYQIKPFDPTGDQFDPNLHEALYQAPIPGKESGTVIDCQKTGYMIKDRVLRAAQVGVAMEVKS